MSLCAVCTQVLSPKRLGSASTTQSSHPQHSSISSFLHSVEQNCLLCWQAYRQLGRPHVQRLQEIKTSEEDSSSSLSDKTRGSTRVTWEILNAESNGCLQIQLGLDIDGMHPGWTEWAIDTPALTLIPTRGMTQRPAGFSSSC